MASLHKNGVEEKKLAKYVSCYVQDDVVTFLVKFPPEHTSGQYGLDIYCREVGNQASIVGEKQLLTHTCKYLINLCRKGWERLLDESIELGLLDRESIWTWSKQQIRKANQETSSD